MSQREFMIVVAHTHICTACRERLLNNPTATLSHGALSPDQKEALQWLKPEDFITPDTLSRAAGIAVADLEAYQDEAVVRLRHL